MIAIHQYQPLPLHQADSSEFGCNVFSSFKILQTATPGYYEVTTVNVIC